MIIIILFFVYLLFNGMIIILLSLLYFCDIIICILKYGDENYGSNTKTKSAAYNLTS